MHCIASLCCSVLCGLFVSERYFSVPVIGLGCRVVCVCCCGVGGRRSAFGRVWGVAVSVLRGSAVGVGVEMKWVTSPVARRISTYPYSSPPSLHTSTAQHSTQIHPPTHPPINIRPPDFRPAWLGGLDALVSLDRKNAVCLFLPFPLRFCWVELEWSWRWTDMDDRIATDRSGYGYLLIFMILDDGWNLRRTGWLSTTN